MSPATYPGPTWKRRVSRWSANSWSRHWPRDAGGTEGPELHRSAGPAAGFHAPHGMVLAVEPMVNMGTAAVVYGDATGWPVVTQDGRPAAHFEHTVAVTDGGVDILTVA